MKQILCFGELLLRLSPQLNGQWIAQNNMPVFIGGAELNCATALAKWELPVSYCTALPDHYLSREIINDVQSKGIDTSKIRLSGNRIGTYYLPQGADLKNAGVIYDRAYSSFWELKPGDIDWDVVLEGMSWLHLSAISPALNENVAAICIETARRAAQKGLTVSIDLNYRSKLWQYGKAPHQVMPELLQHCHVVMGNIWAAQSLLGLSVTIEESKGKTSEELVVAAGVSMKAMHAAYPKVQTIAYTFRLPHSYFAVLQHGGEMCVSQQHGIKEVVDGVGSGDCFMAGLIYGLYSSHPPQEIINFAAAAAHNKLFIKGDATTSSVDQIKKEILHHAG